MNGIENYIGFILAGIILNVTPGPDTIYIVTRSVAQGRKAGIYSVLGILLGALCHTVLAAFGLTMILLNSVVAFSIVKYLGVAYLIYMGGRMLIDKSVKLENDIVKFEQLDLIKIFRQGFFTDLLNPKVAIFFLSIIPQFIKPEYVHGPVPFIILGLTMITTGMVWCLFLVYAASNVTKVLRNNTKIGAVMQKLSGVIFIALGLWLLITN